MTREHAPVHPRAPGRKPTVVKLTEAEAAVVAELARGSSNKEIAAALGLSISAVKHRLAGVYRKLGVGNRLRLLAMVGD